MDLQHKEQSTADCHSDSGMDADLHIAKKPVKNNGRPQTYESEMKLICMPRRAAFDRAALLLFQKPFRKSEHTLRTDMNAFLMTPN
mgnify:FL=1